MSLFLLHSIIYVILGLFAGLMAGLFGIGGGLIVVPGLVFIFEKTQLLPTHLALYVAIGTSLAVMIITAAASVNAHHKIGPILWSVFHKLWPGLVLGTITGSLIAAWIPTQWLTVFFAFFLIIMAIKMLQDARVSHAERFPPNWLNAGINFLIGTNSGLLGVGGGVLVVPYLTYCGVDVRRIAAVSNLCALLIAIVGTTAFILTGFQAHLSAPGLIGYVYWPAVLLIGIPSSLMAPVGARLNYKLPISQLRYGFVAMLILTAISLLY